MRRQIPRYWRLFHALMYVVLFFGIVHANLLGDDFANVGIMLIFDALFVACLGAFAYKRYANYQTSRRLNLGSA